MKPTKVFLMALVCWFLFACEEPGPIEETEDPFIQNTLLIERAKGGDLASIERVRTCLDQTPHYEFKERADYYWLLKLKTAGGGVSDQDIKMAREKLAGEMAQIIEEWDKNPERLAPFTFAGELNC